LGFGRKPADDAVGDLQLLLELVVLQDEVAVAVYDAFTEPGVDTLAVNAVRDTRFTHAHAVIADLRHDLSPKIRVNWFAFGHNKTHIPFMGSADALPIYANRLRSNRFRLCVDYMQRGTVFLHGIDSFKDFAQGMPIARLRSENGTSKLTYKRCLNEAGDMIEHELTIGSADTMRSILKELDFRPITTVDKIRLEVSAGTITYALDKVKNLSDFLEIEITTDNQNEQAEAEQRIMAAAATFGFTEQEIEPKKYDQLIAARGNVNSFTGVKAVLILGKTVLVIQRDNKPGLPFAGLWDLPGGGREGNESPFECASREVREELGIRLKKDNVIWQKYYPGVQNPRKSAYFMVIKVNTTDVNTIVFGDEGQGWKRITLDDFMEGRDVVEFLKRRLQDYLMSVREEH